MADRALQRNAADPKQRDYAARVEKRRVNRRQDLYRAQLATPMGRAFCWDVLEDVGLYQTPFRPAGSETAFLCGEQNVGLRLRARLIEASEEDYQVMEAEARARTQRDHRETDAAHTAPAAGAAPEDS
jgi:hypothetical protein